MKGEADEFCIMRKQRVKVKKVMNYGKNKKSSSPFRPNSMIVRVYTDGACSGNPGPGGWGVIFSSYDGIKKYSGCEDETTNNKMELLAVIKALRLMVKNGPRSKDGRMIEYILYSDSAYVINAITKGWLNGWIKHSWKTQDGSDVKNKELWIEYINAAKELAKIDVRVNFEKVKGHAGNPLNEMVDELAYTESQNLKKWLELS